jgi:hypothetical protein
VVEGGVEPELVEQVGHLLVRPRAADHPMPAKLRELRREAADRSRRGRHPDDVAGAKARDVEETGIGGQAHAAERSQVPLGGGQVGVEPRERAEAAERRFARVDDRVVAPARGMPDDVAGGEPVGAGLDDLADAEDAVQRGAEAEWWEVAGRRSLGQPEPQARVDRRPGVAHHDLTGTGRAHGNLHDAEVVRPRDEVHLAARQRLSTVHALTPGAP